MEFHERLKALRIQASLTQKKLGELVDVSAMTVRNWESGVKQPSMQAIIALTTALGVSADILLGIKPHDFEYHPITQAEFDLLASYRVLDKHGQTLIGTICTLEKSRVAQIPRITVLHEQTHHSPARYIPKYISPSAAGYSVPLDGDEFEMVLVDDSVPDDADYAVRIQGNSMAPYINDGDTVYVKKTSELDIGDVGIFSVDGAMYCKMYYIGEDRTLTLVSANPELADSNVVVPADSSISVVCFGRVLIKESIPFPDYFERA